MLRTIGTAAACVLAAGSLATAQQITTIFDGGNRGNPGGAVYFNVNIASQDLTITGFDTNATDLLFPGTVFGFSVYTLVGTHVGNETNAGLWMLRATGTGTAAGVNQPSQVLLDSPFDLNANTQYGMAIVLEAPGQISGQHEYTNGTGTNQFFQNADLSLSLGSATNIPFSGVPFSPRVWNGTIKYEPADPSVTGGCCFSDGSCQVLTGLACFNQGGEYRGANTDCVTPCPQPGACCIGGECQIMLQSACEQAFGQWDGSATCTGVSCPPAWRAMAPVPEARSRAAGAMIGDYFYFLGGEPRNTTAWRLDLNADEWEPIASLPPVPVGEGGLSNVAAAALGTDIYMVGGWDGTAPHSRVVWYDSVADIWTEEFLDPCPTPIYANALVAHGGNVYVLGGAVASGVLNMNMYIYDAGAPAGTRWSTGPAPALGRQYPAATVIGDRISLVGGTGASVAEERNSIEIFDINTNQWLPLTSHPTMSAPRGGTAAYAVDDELLVASGGWTTYLTTTERFDGTSWSPDLPVLFGGRTLAYAGDGTRLVKAGGWNGAFMNRTEMLTIGDDCYANCDGSTSEPILTVDDFTCFINAFASAQALPHEQQITHYANCDGSTTPPVLTVDDFTCFINEFAQGCP